MDNGLVPGLIFYKLQNEDKVGRPAITTEVVDGQHRLFTVFSFISSEYVELPRKRKFIVYWPYKNEEGKVVPIFYKETDDTREWLAKNTEFEPRYFTEEEMTYFNEFCFDIREIDFQLTMEQRRQIFMSLQNGVQVKNSDWLKNKTDCGLINFMSEHGYEKKMKDVETGILTFSYKKPDNYWIQWVCRFYFLFLAVKKLKNDELTLDEFDNGSAVVFTLGDTDYKNKCTPHDKSLNDPASIVEFHEVFEAFHELLNSDVCSNIEFNPTQLFVLFQYVAMNTESLHLIESTHIRVFYNEGKEQCYRKMWEKNTPNPVRAAYYNDCLSRLYTIIETVDSDVFEARISTKIKHDTWVHWFKDEKTATCPCGGSISKNTNHCGHIVARAKGGKTSVANLRPICASCNLRMKTRNLNEYFTEMGYTA
jgi:5-methylcytosine-specific restriction endonuclease McrA